MYVLLLDVVMFSLACSRENAIAVRVILKCIHSGIHQRVPRLVDYAKHLARPGRPTVQVSPRELNIDVNKVMDE